MKGLNSFIWCWNLDTSGSRSETPGKFWNVVLEKDGKDQLDRACEKWRSISVKEQRNILHEISKRKANWIGRILRRNCLLQRVIEGKIKEGIEVTGRRGRRRRKLLDDLKKRRGYSHLKEEALDRTMWRARFWRGFGPVVRQDYWMNEWMNEWKGSKKRKWKWIWKKKTKIMIISRHINCQDHVRLHSNGWRCSSEEYSSQNNVITAIALWIFELLSNAERVFGVNTVPCARRQLSVNVPRGGIMIHVAKTAHFLLSYESMFVSLHVLYTNRYVSIVLELLNDCGMSFDYVMMWKPYW